MELQFNCPKCANPLSCEKDLAGKQVPCPHCQTKLTVPLLTQVRNCEIKAPGLEGQLREMALIISCVCWLGVVGLTIASFVQQSPMFVTAILALIVVAVVQHFFLAWAAELLAATKKLAGLPYNPDFSLYKNELKKQCNNCNTLVPDQAPACPNCKRLIEWPSASG